MYALSWVKRNGRMGGGIGYKNKINNQSTCKKREICNKKLIDKQNFAQSKTKKQI